MENNTLDSALADRAETLCGVVAHTAYIRRTIDTLREVTTTFVKTYGVVGSALWGDLCRDLSTLRKHVCPLRLEVYQCGDGVLEHPPQGFNDSCGLKTELD